jgi:hypothetical protein
MGTPDFEKSRDERKKVKVRETLALRGDGAGAVQQI